jgi:hypothetical protein
MATHALFTIVADVIDGRDAQLDDAVERFNTAQAFAGFEDLHFASFVLFPGARLKSEHDEEVPASKLILECVIDGPIRPFLRKLVDRCPLDEVFQHCQDYEAGGTADAKLAYLSHPQRLRKPNLYHVGTPYLSRAAIEADRRTRDRLETRLRAASAGWLDATLSRTTAGQREYWGWEILRPWLSVPAAIAGLMLAWWLYGRTKWPAAWQWSSLVRTFVLTLIPWLVELLIAVGSVVLSLTMWLSSAVEFRRRVRPWIWWAVVAVALAAINTRFQHELQEYATAIWILDALFAVATLLGIGTAIAAARDARLDRIRTGGSTESAWRTLMHKPSDPSEPRPRSFPWLTIAKTLAFVFAFLATVAFFKYVVARVDRPAVLIAGMTALLLLRAVWLTFRGFRADGLWMESSHSIAAFLAFAVFAGLAGGYVLTQVPAPFAPFSQAALLMFAWSTLDRLWDWRWWIIGYAPIYMLARPAIEAHNIRLVVGVATSLFLLKGLWLAVIVGWPGSGPWRPPARAVAGATVVGFVASSFLMAVSIPPSLTTLLLLVALFSLWALSIPSPDAPSHPQLPRQELQAILGQEDLDVQNHMAALVPVKQDWFFRAPVLRSFLWVLNRLFFRSGWLRDWYKGKLFGLPTVHFCQWVLLDTRNYIFLSNYDHSWTTYLDDFGTTIASGIDKIWGQGENYPGTSSLEPFKQYARSTMRPLLGRRPHLGWYQAYPGLTLRQIWNNELIVRGAPRADDEESMILILRRFGAAPKTLPELFHETLR